MAKKGRMTVVESTYISAHMNFKTPEEIAGDLDRTVAFVKKSMESLTPHVHEVVREVPAPPVEPPKKKSRGTLDMMTSEQNRGSVIMTQAASERSDAAKKSTGSSRLKDTMSKVYKDQA
jgi:hypothetical protein